MKEEVERKDNWRYCKQVEVVTEVMDDIRREVTRSRS